MIPNFYNASPFLNKNVTDFMLTEIPIFKKYDFEALRFLLICGQKSREPGTKKKDTNKIYISQWKKTEKMMEWMKANKKIIGLNDFNAMSKGVSFEK